MKTSETLAAAEVHQSTHLCRGHTHAQTHEKDRNVTKAHTLQQTTLPPVLQIPCFNSWFYQLLIEKITVQNKTGWGFNPQPDEVNLKLQQELAKF